MRAALSLLGTEILAIELSGSHSPEEPEQVDGVPFGFTGGAGLHAEIAVPMQEGNEAE